MRKIFYLILVLLVLSGCSSNRKRINELSQRVATQEEQITFLVSQMRVLNFEHSRDLIGQEILDTQDIVIESVEQPPQVIIVSPAIPSSLTDQEISRLYNEGRRSYESRDFAAAIRAFSVIANEAPEHALAANSVYWIGESFYALADFSAARLYFQRVQDQYPGSNKFVDAQVKIAMTWIRQNRRDIARTILEAVRRDFPNYERMSVVDQNLRLIRQ